METVHVGINVAEMYANAMTRRLVQYKNYVNNDVSSYSTPWADTITIFMCACTACVMLLVLF